MLLRIAEKVEHDANARFEVYSLLKDSFFIIGIVINDVVLPAVSRLVIGMAVFQVLDELDQGLVVFPCHRGFLMKDIIRLVEILR